IDVGGESTRPDHEPVTIEEEIAGVLPVIEALEKRLSIPISFDLYKAEPVEEAIKEGARIIKVIWGANHDPDIGHVAAKYDVPIILMHNRTNKQYDSLIDDMIVDLEASIKIAKDAGVPDENIIIDPGIGFALELEDNYLVMQELELFTEYFPYPFLLATSRKSFIS